MDFYCLSFKLKQNSHFSYYGFFLPFVMQSVTADSFFFCTHLMLWLIFKINGNYDCYFSYCHAFCVQRAKEMNGEIEIR